MHSADEPARASLSNRACSCPGFGARGTLRPATWRARQSACVRTSASPNCDDALGPEDRQSVEAARPSQGSRDRLTSGTAPSQDRKNSKVTMGGLMWRTGLVCFGLFALLAASVGCVEK